VCRLGAVGGPSGIVRCEFLRRALHAGHRTRVSTVNHLVGRSWDAAQSSKAILHSLPALQTSRAGKTDRASFSRGRALPPSESRIGMVVVIDIETVSGISLGNGPMLASSMPAGFVGLRWQRNVVQPASRTDFAPVSALPHLY
jgi:hypothetical protein